MDQPSKRHLDKVYEDALIFLYKLDARNNKAHFTRLEKKELLGQMAFHFHWIIEGSLGESFLDISCNLENLLHHYEVHGKPRGKAHYIFHMTLGGSTLLCRCLENMRGTAVIKEPTPLSTFTDKNHRFASIKETDPQLWRRYLELISGLYSRNFEAAGTTVIKPFFASTLLADELLNADPRSRSLYIYQNLDEFLVAILKSEERRKGIRQSLKLLTAFHSDLGIFENSHFTFKRLTARVLNELGDPETIVLFWLTNLSLILRLEGTALFDRIRTLNSAQLYLNPRETLGKIALEFGIEPDANEITSIVEGPIFSQDAKHPERKFDLKEKIRNTQKLMVEHREEMNRGMEFAAKFCLRGEVPTHFPIDLFRQAR